MSDFEDCRFCDFGDPIIQEGCTGVRIGEAGNTLSLHGVREWRALFFRDF